MYIKMRVSKGGPFVDGWYGIVNGRWREMDEFRYPYSPMVIIWILCVPDTRLSVARSKVVTSGLVVCARVPFT